MNKIETLKDGTEVSIRAIEPDDAERFYWFLGGLSPEDRKYLRINVSDRELVVKRIRNANSDRVVRLIVEIDAEIIAEGSLSHSPESWTADVGEIRLLISPAYRRKGLGMLLAREIYILAVERRMRRIVAQMMRPQKGARKIFRRLGFREETILPDLLTDQNGEHQDLLVMTVDLEDMRDELAHFFESSDWRRHR